MLLKNSGVREIGRNPRALRVFELGTVVERQPAAVNRSQVVDEPEQLKVKRLFWAGPLTVIGSVVTVLFIRIVAMAILKPDPKFEPLTVGPPTFDTVVAATCAVLVFLATARYSLEPIGDYRALAAKVLVVSFVPDIAFALYRLRWRLVRSARVDGDARCGMGYLCDAVAGAYNDGRPY